MPGLVGFTAGEDPQEDRRVLGEMQRQLLHLPFHAADEQTVNAEVCASRCFVTPDAEALQPRELNGVRVWIDGEIQAVEGEPEAVGRFGASGALARLFSVHGKDSELSFLRRLRGTFAAVVHDQNRRRLHLVCDRHGFRHLYWTLHRGRLAWASELKALLALPGFVPRIDAQAVDDFLSTSAFTADRTWFDDVHLLTSGSVLTWELEAEQTEAAREPAVTRYWSWNEIRPLAASIDEREVVEELGRLFRRAVDRSCHTDERVGAHLSGGLDSRAIVAALPRQAQPLHLFTFGRRGCHDVRIARRVVTVRRTLQSATRHHVIELDGASWLEGRSKAVWWLDGQMNLLDMHTLHSVPTARQYIDVNLDGFLGESVLGGAYLEYPGRTETELLETRARRQILGGIRLGSLFFRPRMPFADNDLLSFALGIPASLRRGSRIYNEMLLSCFPEYFRSIPWQRTGCPLGLPQPVGRIVGPLRSMRYGLTKRLSRIGVRLPDNRAYADYNDWLRLEPARSWFTGLLADPEALYRRYCDHEHVDLLWRRHLAGGRHAEVVCRYATFEVWLRQLLRGELRSEP